MKDNNFYKKIEKLGFRKNGANFSKKYFNKIITLYIINGKVCWGNITNVDKTIIEEDFWYRLAYRHLKKCIKKLSNYNIGGSDDKIRKESS